MNNIKQYGQIILSLRHGQVSSNCQVSAGGIENVFDIFLDTDNLCWQIRTPAFCSLPEGLDEDSVEHAQS